MKMTFAATEKGKKMMTLENAIKTLDEVIPPHTHRTVDREHMPIALAWEAVKVELENRVPVVRCRDCKFSRELNEIEKKAYLDECRACVCLEASQYGYMIVFPGHFCSYGERRTDEG